MRLVVAFVAVCALASCGGGNADNQKVAAYCVENGGDDASCDCMAGYLEENLQPDLFAKLATLAEGGEEALAKARASMPPEEQLSLGINMLGAVEACGEAIL